MFKDNRGLAIVALVLANLIYGINFSIAKIPMESFIKPFGFVLLRSFSAVLFFWFLSYLIQGISKHNLDLKDVSKLILCSFLGASGNQLFFFKGIELTSPINASIIMTLTPVLIFVFSLFIIKEKISKSRWFGVFLAFVGALVLILFGAPKKTVTTSNPILGDFLVFINASLYGLYVVIVKPLLVKYHPIVFLKWFFLFGFIINLPFGLNEVIETKWETINTELVLALGFVFIFTSCFTYLFNLYGIKILKPSSVGVFIYLQPLFATIFAVLIGYDSLNIEKVLAAIFIFAGVYLVLNNQPVKNIKT